MNRSPEFEKALARFLECHTPQRVSKHLRILLMEAMMNNRLAELPNFHDILVDVEGLFHIMDCAIEDSCENINSGVV